MLVRSYPPRCGNPPPSGTPRACILSCSARVSVSVATLGVLVTFVAWHCRVDVVLRAGVGSRADFVVGGDDGLPCSVLCYGYCDGDMLYSVVHCVEMYCTVSWYLYYVHVAV